MTNACLQWKKHNRNKHIVCPYRSDLIVGWIQSRIFEDVERLQRGIDQSALSTYRVQFTDTLRETDRLTWVYSSVICLWFGYRKTSEDDRRHGVYACILSPYQPCAAVRLLRAEGLHLSNGRRQSRPWHARTTETLHPVLNKRMQTKRGVKKTVYILL